METKEYRTIDKSGWGYGPWQEEPDKRQWEDEETGLPCLIVRNIQLGFLCGYVGVQPSHPAHGVKDSFSYDDDGNLISVSLIDAEIDNITVHGGLSFADGCGHGEDESRGICHVTGNGEPDDVWWFGFDCGHAWDVCPGHPSLRSYDGEYRTIEYVERECQNLAKQLRAITE